MAHHFLSQDDFTHDEACHIFDRAAALKPVQFRTDLLGRSLVMFFEKSSTRTRLSFEIGMTQLGGHAIYLDRESSQLSRGESLQDTAKVVSRYADLMMARVYAHDTLVELSHHASIPVINGLSDDEHPCQSMTDLFTMLEHKRRLEGLRVAYVGDGNNNVAHSLMLGAARLGSHIVLAVPPSLRPRGKFLELAGANARSSGGSVDVTDDPRAAVRDADVVYTDVWVSMGRETDTEARRETLRPYQVNRDLVSLAKSDHIFMHCLPAHIGEEVTADVAYGPNSVIFDQAENRLHVQKAIMTYLFESSQGG